jgi:3',5'-cyclic AMP phosphodiesterase CpdA
MHVARHPIDLVIVTGDATDNAQLNELDWFITILDGGRVDPLSGPDDRDPGSLPDLLLDPHQPFYAQGLYRNGVHGDARTIDWYSLAGNHDRFAVGVFPIVNDFSGRRVSLLPLQERIGLFFPVDLDPTGSLSWAPITPGNPGPPPSLSLPIMIQANPERRYFTDREFVEAHLRSVSEPPGHGFDADHPERTWYSVSPRAGLRLIGLNSATPHIEVPTLPYSEGAISVTQVRFLERELERAQEAGEWVIVATHHPSDALEPALGTAVTAGAFRQTLNAYPCVKLHLAGHWHENVVFDRGGYREIVTGSAFDRPQLGRVVELWRQIDAQISEPVPEDIVMRYWHFSHLDEIAPPDESFADLFDDPLLPMRRDAAELAAR